MAIYSNICKAAPRLVGLTLTLAAGAGMAQAAPDGGCSALAAETISLTGAGATATHSTGAVPLRAGETLHLQITALPGEAATGSILLGDGGEAGEQLMAGVAPQQAVYTVPMDGMYSLEFRADGRNELTFEVSCEAQSAAPSPVGPEAFMQRSAARLLADDTAQASLQRRASKPQSLDQAVKTGAVMGANGSPQQITVATSMQNIAAAEGKVFADDKLDIWAEGRVSQSRQRVEENGAKYGIEAQGGTLYLGSDYLLRPGLMIGGLLQLDQYRESYGASLPDAANHGVMFGPYASVRLAPDVVFDARAAWGTAEAETETLNGTRFAFDTERQLLRGALSGNRSLYGVKFTPSVALAVVENRLADPASVPPGSFTEESSTIGRLGLGSGMSYRIALDDGSFLQPNAALSTGWNVDAFDKLALASAHVSNEGGAKAEAGFTLGTAEGISVQATGAVEGIGKDDYSAWSGRLSLTAPLN